MSKWLMWIILSSLLGNPVLAAVVLLVGWWALDRFTFRFLPNPLALLRRWQRGAKLRRTLEVNPHDRKARYELAELEVEKKRYARAVELLKPNLEAGDDDVPTVYLMGVACLGAGHAQQGEALLAEVERMDPTFRLGAIELERGRWRLAQGDFAGAISALEKFLAARHGTVEGRVLLANAYERAGRAADAAKMRDLAWSEYAHSPGFRRRVERFWAWRAKPWRPLAYLTAVLILGAVFSQTVGPALARSAQAAVHAQASDGYDDTQYSEDAP